LRKPHKRTSTEGLREREQTYLQHNEELAAKLQELQEAASQTRIELESLTAEQNRAAEEHAEKTTQMRALNEEWQSLREQKSSIEARLRSLRELRESYEGYAAGVRAVMDAKKNHTPGVNGIIGPVGDLLSTEKTYERAVEAALGGNIHNIIVEEADAAKSTIAFLKEHRAGRVTFLPLDIIRPGHADSSDSLGGLPGIIGPAIEYVTYDAPIQKAVEYLLCNTVIVETLDDAIRIARSEKPFPRLVTLEGDVVSPAGSVTGGQTQHESRGLLGRGAEISELEEDAEKTDADIQVVAEKTQNLTAELEQLTGDLDRFEQEAAEKRRERNTVDLEIAKYSTERDSLTQTLGQLGTQREESEAARALFENQRQEALVRANTMELDDVALQEAVAEAAQQAAEAREALSVQAAELADMRVQLAALSQRLEEVQRDALREQEEQEAAVRDAKRRVEQMAQLKQNEASLEEEVALNIERSRALSESREEAREKVVEAQNQQQALLDETETLTKTLRDLHGITRETQAEVHRLEIELRHDEDQIHFFEERILSEYHMALSSLDAEKVGTDDYDDETREAMVAEIRQKLDRMGPVNVMAIEEYEDLEKRNDFLVTQEADLRKARETLLGVVSRIDKTILAMFMETFEKVSDSFRTLSS